MKRKIDITPFISSLVAKNRHIGMLRTFDSFSNVGVDGLTIMRDRLSREIPIF